MKQDVIVDEVRGVRQKLIEKHGGLDGWIEHLQQMDRQRARKPGKKVVGKRTSTKKKARKRVASTRSGRVGK